MSKEYRVRRWKAAGYLSIILVFAAILSMNVAASAEADSLNELLGWEDMKQLEFLRDYDGRGFSYAIGLDRQGDMYLFNNGIEDNEDFEEQVKALGNVNMFLSGNVDGHRFYAAVLKNDGTVAYLSGISDGWDEGITNGVSSLNNVKSIALDFDDNNSPAALYAVLDDGSVKALGDRLNEEVLSWQGMEKLVSLRDGNIIGIREDGSCLMAGDCFEKGGVCYPGNYDFSLWKNVKDVFTTVCCWGVDTYAVTGDGTLLSDSSQVIAENVVSRFFDRNSYHLYMLLADGTGRFFCGEYCTAPDRHGVKSVGAGGLAVTENGGLISLEVEGDKSEYTFRAYSDAECTIPLNSEINRILQWLPGGTFTESGSDFRCIAETEDGGYCIVCVTSNKIAA